MEVLLVEIVRVQVTVLSCKYGSQRFTNTSATQVCDKFIHMIREWVWFPFIPSHQSDALCHLLMNWYVFSFSLSQVAIVVFNVFILFRIVRGSDADVSGGTKPGGYASFPDNQQTSPGYEDEKTTPYNPPEY